MNPCDEFIRKIEEKLPEQCKVEDLVQAGLFTSHQTARLARIRGDSPAYFKFGKMVIYPRDAVIEWVKNHKYEGKNAVSAEKIKSAGIIKNLHGETRVA